MAPGHAALSNVTLAARVKLQQRCAYLITIILMLRLLTIVTFKVKKLRPRKTKTNKTPAQPTLPEIIRFLIHISTHFAY